MRTRFLGIAALVVVLCGCPTDDGEWAGAGTPVIHVQPLSLVFGDVEAGSSSEKTLTVWSTGTASLHWDIPLLDGEGAFGVDATGHHSPLDPEASVILPVVYAPAGHEAASATLRFYSDDPADPEVTVALTGRGIAPFVQLDPATTEFADCEVGVNSEQTIAIRNVGSADLVVDEQVFTPTSEEYSIEFHAELDGVIPPGEQETATVYYDTADALDDVAYLTVQSNDPLQPEVVATVSGTAHYADAVTDTFVQGIPHASDILFVVDNSCSMGWAQGDLSDQAEEIIGLLDDRGLDYHLAAVTTDAPEFQGAVPLITPATLDPVAALQDALSVGTNGAPSERGLVNALGALTPPLTDPGGANEGFLRDDAGLRILFFSDADDESPQAAGHYVQQIQALLDDPDDLTLLGIIPPSPTAPQYETAIAMTHGYAADIEGDWQDDLPQLADLMTHDADTFVLSEQPLPETLEVTVAGEATPAGWIYEPVRNAIVFEPAFLPGEGEAIVVGYYPWGDSCL